MKDILKNKWVSWGAVVVLCGGLAYYVWTTSSSGDLLTSDTQTSPLSQDLLTTLSTLHTIKLDPSLFKDPVFQSLTDYGVTIPSQNAGRRNPFAPVGK